MWSLQWPSHRQRMGRRQHDKHHCYVTCHGHQYRLLRPWSDHWRMDLPSSGQASVQPWSWSQCRICGSLGIIVLRTDSLLSAAEQQGTVESRWAPLDCLRILVVSASFLWLGLWLDTLGPWNSFRAYRCYFGCELVNIFQLCRQESNEHEVTWFCSSYTFPVSLVSK